MAELNPNHPVTAALHNHWHKIVGLMMAKMGVREYVITREEIAQFIEIFDAHIVTVRMRAIITEAEARELLKRECGQPN